ncbi:MAG: phage holin family protein [Caldilineaceae bacterium]|nr:phage holin family protein [Caldilineaceae bacterium]
MGDFIASWIVTTISLLIISNLPLGIEIRSFRTALIGALVLGLLNALLLPILQFLAIPITFLTLGLFSFVVSAIVFALAARLVDGFYLRNGFWSALVGSILVGILNSLIFWIF